MDEPSQDRLQKYLDEYGVSHQNPTNRIIHKICVPLIVWSLIGALGCFRWTIEGFVVSGAEIAALPALLFYRSLGRGTFYLMFAMIAGMIWSHRWLEKLPEKFLDQLPQSWIQPEFLSGQGWDWTWSNRGGFYLVIFALAWIGQFVGHHIEGRRPSFMKDLLFLLIGPIWIFRGRGPRLS